MADVDGTSEDGLIESIGSSLQYHGAPGYETQTGFITMGPSYRMRAYDTGRSASVYWDATSIDMLGAQYDGPGPLHDIVVVNVLV